MSKTLLKEAEEQSKEAASAPGEPHSRQGKAEQKQERHEQWWGTCPDTHTLSFTGTVKRFY